MSPHVCYGGTFDPFHNGHLAIALAVADALSARVHLLPSADPPHRAAPGASAEDRAAMLELAAAGEPRLAVDRRELRRAGRSYSIDTLRDLRAELGGERPLVWVVGGDSLLQLATWKDWRGLFGLAHLLAVPRPGLDLSGPAMATQSPELWSELEPRCAELAALGLQPCGRLAVLQLPSLRSESATEVRRRIGEDRDWQALVPQAVAGHVVRRGLYGAGGVRPAATGGTDEGQGV